jgi:hypothetical protein
MPLLSPHAIELPSGVLPVDLHDAPAPPAHPMHSPHAVGTAKVHGGTPNPTLIDAGGGGGYYSDGFYDSDYGGYDYAFGDDQSGYDGDYGNYDNQNDDMSDGYTAVDAPGGGGTYTHARTALTSAEAPGYFVYSQSSGNFLYVHTDGSTYQIATGYSGNTIYANNPDAQIDKGLGPLPQGEYTLTAYDNHKGPETIFLAPDPSNNMYGRDNFLIHGDNGQNNHSASEGCIILDRTTRDYIINSGVVRLYVTR